MDCWWPQPDEEVNEWPKTCPKHTNADDDWSTHAVRQNIRDNVEKSMLHKESTGLLKRCPLRIASLGGIAICKICNTKTCETFSTAKSPTPSCDHTPICSIHRGPLWKCVLETASIRPLRGCILRYPWAASVLTHRSKGINRTHLGFSRTN